MQELLVEKIHFFQFLSISDKPRLHQPKIITFSRSSTVQASRTVWMFLSVQGNTIKEGEISYVEKQMQSLTNLSSTLKFLIP